MKHKASIKGGRVVFDNPSAWTVDCAKHEGNQVTITLDQKRAVRTLNQNRYCRGVVVEMLREPMGFDFHQSDDCWATIKIVVGHCYQTKYGLVAKPSRDLTTKEFTELIDKVRAFASLEFGLHVPSPNETDYGV